MSRLGLSRRSFLNAASVWNWASLSGFPVSALGFWVSGDLAGKTIYTNRNGLKVFYNESPAGDPASGLQLTQRTRFRKAQQAWSAQSPGVKAAYEELVNQASLCLTGQNLWISVSLRHTVSTLKRLQATTGVSVPTPPLF